MRDYVTDILGQSGFNVIAASTGEEAQARIAQGGVCAVVSDVAMPGRMNGFELARWVRQECPRTGVVLVSGVMEPSKAHLPGGVMFRAKARQSLDAVAPRARGRRPARAAAGPGSEPMF